MHISDGILPFSVITAGYAAGGALCAWSAYRMRDDEIPRTAVFSAAFFLASLIHVKVMITSVHLVMNGLTGIVLGRRCVLAITIGLFLQAALFGHGGFSVLGVNILIFALPAIASGLLFQWIQRYCEAPSFWTGAVCGGISVLFSGILFMFVLLTVGESFQELARFALIAHIPIMLIESIVTGFTLRFLSKVHPVLLRREAST